MVDDLDQYVQNLPVDENDDETVKISLANTASAVERQRWITYNGIRILIRDYSNLAGDDGIRVARLHEAWLQKTTQRNMRMLIDVTGTIANKELVAIFKKSAKESKALRRFHKIAVIGASGLIKYFALVVNKFSNIGAVLFDSEEEAMKWLTE